MTIACLAIALLIGAGIATWNLVLRDRLVPKRFGIVVPGEFYRSGQISRFLIADVIDKNHLGTIIDLNGVEPENADQQVEVAVARSHGVQHHRFALRGNGTGDINRFASAIETIVDSQRRHVPVLVHCAAGTQRTGACVSFYRLLVRKDPPESVYEELIRYGWDPQADTPLIEYVNGHITELAEILVARHVIDGMPETMPTLHP